MTGGAGKRASRRAVWWPVGSRVSLVLVLVLCASAGIRVASPVRLALELTTAIPVLILAAGLARAYRRHRRDGPGRHAAFRAVYADAVPRPARKLMVHEAVLRRRPSSRRRRNPDPRPRAADHAVKMNRRPIS
jgi:hypothetical protein